jgi:hypothetical protein
MLDHKYVPDHNQTQTTTTQNECITQDYDLMDDFHTSNHIIRNIMGLELKVPLISSMFNNCYEPNFFLSLGEDDITAIAKYKGHQNLLRAICFLAQQKYHENGMPLPNAAWLKITARDFHCFRLQQACMARSSGTRIH